MSKLLKGKRKKMIMRVASVVLALVLAAAPVNGGLFAVQEVYAAGVPGFDDTVSEDNIKSLMRAYDKDGLYLTQFAMKSDPGFFSMLTSSYFSPDSNTVDTLDTVAHEAFHEYAMPYTGYLGAANSERIYTGAKKNVKVSFTDVFPSSEMANTVPKRCRTATYNYNSGDRFETYVADPTGDMLSDTAGAYGLLNEFGGYCWGMNDNNSMFDYRDKFDDTTDTWESFIMEGESDRLAYAEFKYYILHYMYYAKQHHPDVYKGIVANKNFRKAYRLTEKRFSEEIEEYEDLLDSVNQKLKKGSGVVLTKKKLVTRRQYNAMIKEMNKSRYKAIQKEITKP